MKNDLQVKNNIYTLLDNEMARMHALLQLYMQLPKDYSIQSSRYNANPSDMGTLYKRLLDMQDVLMKAFEQHEPLIQEKVAELALTGDTDK